MANRPRLDPAVEAEARTLIDELLEDLGYVSDEQIAALARFVDRSERQVRRWVDEGRAARGIQTRRPVASEEFESSLDALLAGAPFEFDEELCTVAHAYAGNIARLHADAKRHAGDAKLISYSQLNRKFRREVGNDHRKLMRKGIAGFKNASLYTRWEAPERNDVWQIDATQLDIWIIPQGTTTPVRPWALAIIDDRTRVNLSTTLMLHEYNAADALSCAFRAIRTREVTLADGTTTTVGGLPHKILCDNAQQFTGELMTTLALDLSFLMSAVAVYSGEQKGKVERLMRSLNEELCRTLPGYASKAHKTLSMRDSFYGKTGDLLDDVQLLDELARWVEAKNNSPHPTTPGKTRYQVWAEDQTPLRLAKESQLRGVTVPLGRPSYVFQRSGFGIQRDGVVTHYSHITLSESVGDKFHLRHIPGETSWVDAYDLDGRFIVRCWDTERLTKKERGAVNRNRVERYRTAASLRSKAVELRSVAVAATREDELPNPFAVAATRQTAPSAPEMVVASLGLDLRVDTSTGEVIDVEPEPENGDSASAPAELALLDSISAAAVAAAATDGDEVLEPPPSPQVNPKAKKPKAKKSAASRREADSSADPERRAS